MEAIVHHHPNSEIEEQRQLFRDARAESTWRAYESDWRVLEGWLTDKGHTVVLPLSPELVWQFVFAEEKAKRSVATIERRLVTIAKMHQARRLPDPTKDQSVREAMQSVRRRSSMRRRGAKQAEPFRLSHIHKAVKEMDTRTRCIVALAFLSACRRSEITALNIEDVEVSEEGVAIHIWRSKTDQTGKGRVVFIPDGSGGIAVNDLVQSWMQVRGEGSGPFFGVCDRTVATIAKRVARICDLDPSKYSAHSFRAGFVTEAAASGVQPHKIMVQTGHRSMDTLMRYVRLGRGFKDSPASDLIRIETNEEDGS